MKYNEEYIETLIKTVELNTDQTWTGAFHQLREDKDLPGGGMGSLNDWSPAYNSVSENAWYNLIYYLIKEWYIPKALKQHYEFFNYQKYPVQSKYENDLKYSIDLKNNESLNTYGELDVLECDNCKSKFCSQYTFELTAAKRTFLIQANKNANRLSSITLPENGYKSKVATEIRTKLRDLLLSNNIELLDKIRPCNKCDSKEMKLHKIKTKI